MAEGGPQDAGLESAPGGRGEPTTEGGPRDPAAQAASAEAAVEGRPVPDGGEAVDERPSAADASRLEDGGRSPHGAGRYGEDGVGIGPAESLPGARRPVDDQLGADRTGSPDRGWRAHSVPGARPPVDDRLNTTADDAGCHPGEPVDRRSSGAADEAASAAGSSQSVAAAVAHVLAARAAAHSPDADRHGEARDRLLAVLLDDPLRAVGAAVDLQECQDRIDRLAATLNDERTRLGDVLSRLASAGLRPDQLARLSGLSDAEVDELLRRGLGG